MATRTVFVGSLSESTNEQSLRELFSQYGTINRVNFIWSDREYGIHKGAAFVQFSSAEEANAATGANGQELDGRTIKVSMSGQRAAKRTQATDPNKSVYIGNLTFEVTEDEIRQAFSNCGEVTTIRLPKFQDTGKPRGFGYVTFDTVEARDNALQCNGMELAGRSIRVQNVIERSSVNGSEGQVRGNARYGQRRSYNDENGDRQRRPRRREQYPEEEDQQ